MSQQLQVSGDTSTKQGSEELLKWNQRKVLSHLLAMEEHIQDLSPEEIVHSWCVTKHHLLAVDHHLWEAIGHAERSGHNPDPYRIFREKLLKLEAYPEPKAKIEDLVKLRTQWRYIIGDPTLGETCEICDKDVDVEALRKALLEFERKLKPEKILQEETASFRELEEDMARKIVKSLSQKYKVSTPKLEFLDSCNRPDFGVYNKKTGTIKVCRGNASAHVICHEFSHHLQHETGKPLNEAEAEKFALQEIRKNLYSPYANYSSSGVNPNMISGKVEPKNIALIIGAEHVGYGLVRGAQWIDTQYPGALMGQDPSLLIDIAGLAGGIAGGIYLKPPYDLLAVLLGGYVSTDLWRHVEKMLAPPAPVVVARPVAAAPAVARAQTRYTPTRATRTQGARYTVTR